jgi:SAM-dependent methyltransferase
MKPLSPLVVPGYVRREDVDAFEALVQVQQPAAQPWTPVTDYSFEARKVIEEPHAQLIADVFRPRDVLDVGCGPGHLVRLLREAGLSARGCDVTPQVGHPGFFTLDISSDRAAAVALYDPLPHPDLVVCREVLEHLTVRQIRRAVTNLCRLSSRYVYVTTRFHPDPQSLLDVATSDDLDPTHITLLNQDFLRVLFVLEGFTRRADLEERMDWKHLNRVLVYERA